MTLRGIPTARRHIYFYVLLLLSTIILNDVWQAARQLPESAAIQEVRRMQQATRNVQPMRP